MCVAWKYVIENINSLYCFRLYFLDNLFYINSQNFHPKTQLEASLSFRNIVYLSLDKNYNILSG